MEVRLLLAFLLMGAVMFLTPYFFKSQVPPPGKKDAADRVPNHARHAHDCRSATAPPPAAAVEKVSAAASLPANATPQKPEPAFIIDTDLYRIAFSNQGAHRPQLAAQEIQGQRQQAAGPGQHRRRPGFPLLPLLPRRRSPPPTSTGPGTSRPAIPTVSASPTSSPTATSASARSSASRRTATSRWSPPRSRSTASRCPT